MGFADFYIVRLIYAWIIRSIVYIAVTRRKAKKPHPLAAKSFYYISNGQKLRIDAYLPASGHDPVQSLPIHVNFHGSGYTIAWLGADDPPVCQWIADKAHCVVLDVDYSKSPEKPWPAPTLDADAAVLWAYSHAAENGWDSSRISIGGSSAGGNLALIACTAGTQRDRIRAVAAFYPVVDFTQSNAAKAEKLPKSAPKKETQRTVSAFNFFLKCYLPRDPDRLDDPRLSPGFADSSLFPPSVTLITGSHDLLSSEVIDLANRLSKAKNVDVKHYSAERQLHAWDNNVKAGSEGEKFREEAYNLVSSRLKEALWGDI